MNTSGVIGCKRLDGGADCLVLSGCSKCANAIYDTPAPVPDRACGTCHLACDCREHKVAVLIKAALDAATELDGLKGAWAATYPTDEAVQEEAARYQSTVERVYNACEALGVEIGSADETPKQTACALEEETHL